MARSGSIALALLALAACRREPTQGPAPAARPAPSASASATRSPDQIEPGELAEGTVVAFGLALPRRMQLERSFGDSASATGRVPLESVANYVRRRVDAETIDVGPARTVFGKATVHGKPGRTLRIEVTAGGEVTHIVLRDVTPPPLSPAADEAERWRRAGLSPDGKQLDKTKLR